MSNSFVIPWTVVWQVPLSIEFPRQEYWCVLSFSSLGNLLNPGVKPTFIGRQILYHWTIWKALRTSFSNVNYYSHHVMHYISNTSLSYNWKCVLFGHFLLPPDLLTLIQSCPLHAYNKIFTEAPCFVPMFYLEKMGAWIKDKIHVSWISELFIRI